MAPSVPQCSYQQGNFGLAIGHVPNCHQSIDQTNDVLVYWCICETKIN